MSDMPISLTPESIDHTSERALFRQLADVIRTAIDNDELRPDELLPSEKDIAAAAELNRTTVRDALDILVFEGRIVKTRGRPTRVAVPPPVRHMATSRYAEALAILRAGGDLPLTSAFVTDHGIRWDQQRIDADYNEDTASDAPFGIGFGPDAKTEAEWLEVPVGTPILRRHLVKWAKSDPVQLQESIMPLDLVADTPVADPANQPWPLGTVGELYSLGFEISRVAEDAIARVPTAAEKSTLKMATAAPVLEVVRQLHVGDRVGECSVAVVPAARTILRWETDLS